MNSHSNNNSREAGFSLVEVMVSMALLGMTVLATALLQTSQFSSQGAAKLQFQARQSAGEIVSNITANPALFPVVFDSSSPSRPISYVGCFWDDGKARDRVGPDGGGPGLIGVFPSSTTEHHKQYTDTNGGVQVCPLNQGGLEVHVFPTSPATLEISVVFLPGTRSFALPESPVTTSVAIDLE